MMKKITFTLFLIVLMLPLHAHAATLYSNFPASRATYAGGGGADTVTGIDSNDSGFFVAGKAPGYAPSGITPTTPLGDGEGLVVRYDLEGAAAGAARFPGEVLDLEINSVGQMVVCGSFGIAAVNTTDLSTVLYSVNTLGSVSRCAIGDDGISAGIAGGSIYVYDIGGTQQGTWQPGGSVNDVTVHSTSQSVIETGYTQAASDLQVAYLRGRSYTGDVKWTNYDFSAGDVKAAGLGADSRGERVSIGEDGKLYFSGYVDGGNAIYGRNPRNVNEVLSSSQLIKTDAYNDPYNISGAKALGWFGRFDAATGIIDRGQFLLTRLSDGSGNSISIKAITAATDGTVYLGGEAYASIENRASLKVSGTTIGGYAGGEPFALVISPDLSQRIFWTSFAAPGKSAGGSPAYGISVRGTHAALGVTLNLGSGQRGITVNATQNDVGGGASDGYLVFWQTDVTAPDKPILTSPADGTTVNTHAPLFGWTGANADEVKVTVKDPAGVKVFKQKYNAGEVCTGNACQVSPGATDNLSLENGAGYTWKVVASNELAKVKSDKATFTVDFPGAPVLTSPAAGADVSSTPTLEWQEVAAATQYKVVITRVSDGTKVKTDWLSSATICGSGTCSYTVSSPLQTGEHTWRVTARQESIPNKSKSEKRAFNVTGGLLPAPAFGRK
jgi:hypothetical protein